MVSVPPLTEWLQNLPKILKMLLSTYNSQKNAKVLVILKKNASIIYQGLAVTDQAVKFAELTIRHKWKMFCSDVGVIYLGSYNVKDKRESSLIKILETFAQQTWLIAKA